MDQIHVQLKVQLPLHIKDQIIDYYQSIRWSELYSDYYDRLSTCILMDDETPITIYRPFLSGVQKRLNEMLVESDDWQYDSQPTFEVLATQHPLILPPDLAHFFKKYRFKDDRNLMVLGNVLMDYGMEKYLCDDLGIFTYYDYRIVRTDLHSRFTYHFTCLNPNSSNYGKIFYRGHRYIRRVADTFSEWIQEQVYPRWRSRIK